MTDLAPTVVELVACPVRPEPEGRLPEMPFRQNAWTPQEIATLETGFRADIPLAEIAAALGRGLAGVRDKVATLGLRRHSQRPWTPDEDNWLSRHYGSRATADVAADLGRACSAVYARAGVLGLTEGNPPRWTSWEDAQLRAGYAAAVPIAQIAILIGRPLSGTASRANSLGLRHPAKPPDWTEAEAMLTLSLAEEGHRYGHIASLLVEAGYCERSKIAIKAILQRLGYGRGWGRSWTPEEDALLTLAYREGKSLTPLLTRLGRTRCSIRWRSEYLGLRGTHAMRDGFRGGPVWSDDDIATLRALYGKIPMTELATRMGRTKASLFTRANNLGLVHGYQKPWTDDERHALKRAYDNGVAFADVVTALGRNHAAVHKYAQKMGLLFGRRPRCTPPPTLDQILAMEEIPGDKP